MCFKNTLRTAFQNNFLHLKENYLSIIVDLHLQKIIQKDPVYLSPSFSQYNLLQNYSTLSQPAN